MYFFDITKMPIASANLSSAFSKLPINREMTLVSRTSPTGRRKTDIQIICARLFAQGAATAARRKSVLGAIPIQQLLVLAPSKKILKLIVKIEHGFLWVRRADTLRIQEIGDYLHLWQPIAGTTLSDEPDCLLWKWTLSGVYTARSAYLATFHGSTTCPAWKHIWKAWAPHEVNFFMWYSGPMLDRRMTRAASPSASPAMSAL